MRRTLLLGLVLATIPLTAVAQEQAQPTPDQIVNDRQSKMGRGGGTLAALKQAADSGGDLAALAPRIDWLIHWADELPTLFPEGTDNADSGARAEVWSDHAGFQQAAERFQAATRALAAPAAAGNREAFSAALAEVRASCGACHTAYKN